MLKNKEVYPESSRWRKQALSFLVLSFLVSVCTIFMINAVRSAVNTTRFLDSGNVIRFWRCRAVMLMIPCGCYLWAVFCISELNLDKPVSHIRTLDRRKSNHRSRAARDSINSCGNVMVKSWCKQGGLTIFLAMSFSMVQPGLANKYLSNHFGWAFRKSEEMEYVMVLVMMSHAVKVLWNVKHQNWYQRKSLYNSCGRWYRVLSAYQHSLRTAMDAKKICHN
jgi:hypothetical protein